MTDAEHAETTEAPDREDDRTTDREGRSTDRDDRDERGGTENGEFRESDPSLVRYVQWSLFAVLVLVVLVATFQLYFSASRAIDRFVTTQYRPLFQATFNLVVLLVAGIGLSQLVRRMR